MAIAQNFDGRKLECIAAQNIVGRENIGGVAGLHSKSARIKVVGR